MDSTSGSGQPEYLAVKGWEKYQVIQHGLTARRWFKLYVSILDNGDWLDWTWAERGVWVAVLALRARLGQNLPGEPSRVIRILGTRRNESAIALRVIRQRISDGHLIPTDQQEGYENSGQAPDKFRPRLDKTREDQTRPEESSKSVGRLVSLFYEKTSQRFYPTQKERAQIAELERQHGEATLITAFKRWRDRPQGFNGLEHPFSLFVCESAAYIRDAKRPKTYGDEMREAGLPFGI